MNKLQQEIKDFHEKINSALEKILKQHNQKTIIMPCKKLIQKCSFKSLSDTSSLCSLAYWLYIYGNKQFALELCEYTTGVDFVFEYRISGYPEIFGLEIRIARELLGENRKDNIPPHLLEYYLSKKVKKQLRYPEILREEEISVCNDRFLNTELLYALYNMIGKGETRLYTELNKNWDEIEQTIIDYIDCLKNSEISQ